MSLAEALDSVSVGDRAASCRFCGRALRTSLVDLGAMPSANAYLTAAQLREPEPHYPLHVRVCDGCFLVQLEAFHTPAQLFSEYRYFSSFSKSWLDHAARFARDAVERFALSERTLVMEVASNDGYLLRFFRERKIPVLGIEPAANVAFAAQRRGIPTLVEFFGTDLARTLAHAGQKADLLIGNNVLAHVPDLNDFVRGLATALKPEGVLVMEFPHLLKLLVGNQFDTIYHEHFSYFSLLTVEKVFAAHGLALFDVEEIPTHGGSLRVFATHAGRSQPTNGRLPALREAERRAKLDRLDAYLGFAERVAAAKRRLLRFLIEARDDGKTVVGYGAPAKGNTLLNAAGIKPDLLPFTVDVSPYKQGLFLPGSRIPIHAPEQLRETRPDYVLILPWNLREEIMASVAYIREWGGRFAVPIPSLEVLP